MLIHTCAIINLGTRLNFALIKLRMLAHTSPQIPSGKNTFIFRQPFTGLKALSHTYLCEGITRECITLRKCKFNVHQLPPFRPGISFQFDITNIREQHAGSKQDSNGFSVHFFPLFSVSGKTSWVEVDQVEEMNI